jgi:predicted MPP superfamily phosphohydrolase
VTALLDVNVLMAMLWPRHSFFRHASGWFAKNHGNGWASCPLSQAGFVRLYTQRAVIGMDISAQEAMDVLKKNCAPSLHHVFWPQEFSVLLSHTPEIYRQAAHADFNLLLSGHTHGGQICLPGSIPIILDAVLPRRMGAGAWQYHNMTGYTSVGAGSSVVPVRLNCPPEITLHCLGSG